MSKQEQQPRMNPALYEQARRGMSDVDVQQYQNIGKEFYESFDFEKMKTLTPSQDADAESIAYITEAVKSGLHPDYLDENEVYIMEQHYGKDWRKRFAYA